jgi:hypothetical protein
MVKDSVFWTLWSFETLASVNPTTQRNIPEDIIPNIPVPNYPPTPPYLTNAT